MMRRLFTIGFLVVMLTIALTFMIQTEYAMADDGTVIVAEEGLAEQAQPSVTNIWLEDFSGNILDKIPKGEAFMIWAIWQSPKDEPRVRFKLRYKEGAMTFKHRIVKRHKNATGVIGSGCSTALTPWVDSGQYVTIRVRVRDIGRRAEIFQVE